MKQSLFALLPLLLLGGCQWQAQPADKPARVSESPAAADCFISDKRHSILLDRELRYLQAQPSERQLMLDQSRQAQDYAQTALLLSQVSADSEALRQALAQYAKQGLRPKAECGGDRYILLRQKQTQLLLAQRQGNEKQRALVRQLRRQIEALTAIESELSLDREQLQ